MNVEANVVKNIEVKACLIKNLVLVLLALPVRGNVCRFFRIKRIGRVFRPKSGIISIVLPITLTGASGYMVNQVHNACKTFSSYALGKTICFMYFCNR
ncbi:MAG: hypothetical protein LBG96_05700 [Tannerella sp.]|nr:hypothetical protein [Tannerella sp.]